MKIKVIAKDSDYLGQEFEVIHEMQGCFQVKCGFTFHKSRCKVVKRFVYTKSKGFWTMKDKETKQKYFVGIGETTKKKAVKELKEKLGITADKREIKIK